MWSASDPSASSGNRRTSSAATNSGTRAQAAGQRGSVGSRRGPCVRQVPTGTMGRRHPAHPTGSPTGDPACRLGRPRQGRRSRVDHRHHLRGTNGTPQGDPVDSPRCPASGRWAPVRTWCAANGIPTRGPPGIPAVRRPGLYALGPPSYNVNTSASAASARRAAATRIPRGSQTWGRRNEGTRARRAAPDMQRMPE